MWAIAVSAAPGAAGSSRLGGALRHSSNQALPLRATARRAAGGIIALADHGAVYGIITSGGTGFALTRMPSRPLATPSRDAMEAPR